MGWQSCTDKKSFTYAILDALCKAYDFSLDTPFQDYPQEIQDVIIHGTNGREVKVHYKGQRGEGVYDVAFEGLIRNVERRYRETSSETMKAEYEEFMRITPCRKCGGQRLKAEALAVTVGGKNIAEVTEMSIENLQTFMGSLELTQQQKMIGGQILKEIQAENQVFDGRRSGLPNSRPCYRNIIRRRSAENPSCDTDWFRSGGSGLYFGRAEYRPAPEG